MQKKFFAVATFALAFAVAFSASAYDLGSTTLKRGSTGAAVSQLQMGLNACNAAGLSTDGVFGRGTEAAVKAFQASKGLTADGLAGNATKAALNSCGSTAPSAPSTTSTVPGCAAGAMFSATTGAPCTVSSWGTSSAEGYIADAASDSANKVSDVYESEADKVVHGFRVTAKLADQKVERVQVIFDNNSGNGSTNLSRYISSVSLWNGSTKIATMSVANADRSNVDDSYTFNFTGLSGIIAKDTVGRFYVSVNANGSIDTNDTSADWTVSIPSSGFRATSPNGVYVSGFTPSNGVSDVTTLSFGKFSSSGVKATMTLASSSPVAYTQEVSKTTITKDVTLLDFNVKAEVSPVTLRNLPVTLMSSATPSAFINNLKLMKDGQIVADVSPAGVVTFTNLNTALATVPAGATQKFSVVAEFNSQGATYGNYANGVTVSAKVTSIALGSWSIVDSAGDQITSRSGSANGYLVTLASTGASSSFVSSSYMAPTNGTSTADGTISITMNVTAFGGDVTIDEDQFNNTGSPSLGAGADYINYTITGASAADAIASVAGITKVGGEFTIPEGQTRAVTLSLKVKQGTVSGFVKLAVSSVDDSATSNIETPNY